VTETRARARLSLGPSRSTRPRRSLHFDACAAPATPTPSSRDRRHRRLSHDQIRQEFALMADPPNNITPGSLQAARPHLREGITTTTECRPSSPPALHRKLGLVRHPACSTRFVRRASAYHPHGVPLIRDAEGRRNAPGSTRVRLSMLSLSDHHPLLCCSAKPTGASATSGIWRKRPQPPLRRCQARQPSPRTDRQIAGPRGVIMAAVSGPATRHARPAPPQPSNGNRLDVHNVLIC